MSACCWGDRHLPGCRPARPLCRVMRKKRDDRAPCFCGKIHWPHRRGWCVKRLTEYMNALAWGPAPEASS